MTPLHDSFLEPDEIWSVFFVNDNMRIFFIQMCNDNLFHILSQVEFVIITITNPNKLGGLSIQHVSLQSDR